MRKTFAKILSAFFLYCVLAHVAGAAQPTGVFNRIVTQDPSSQSAVIAGGIIAGSQRNQIVDFSGRIPALTPQYFASLDGSQLTNVTVGALQGRTICADVPSNLQVLTWITGDNCWKPSSGGVLHALLSANHNDTVAAAPVLGDIIASNNTPAWQRVAGSISATKQFLTQTGNGAVSALPAWDTIAAGDVPNLDASKITTGLLALVHGGTNADLSATGGANQVLRQSSTGAAITVGQLAATNLSDYVENSSWTPTWGGFSVAPTGGVARYIKVGKLVLVYVNGWAAGTSNATTTTITLPFASRLAVVMAGMGHSFDNGAFSNNPGRIDTRAASTTADLYMDLNVTAWTASGAKLMDFALVYEIN